MARGPGTLAERLARVEEALVRLEAAVTNHLRHLQAVTEQHEGRLRSLERERNHLQGRHEAYDRLAATARFVASLLVPALSGSVMALLIARLLGG